MARQKENNDNNISVATKNRTIADALKSALDTSKKSLREYSAYSKGGTNHQDWVEQNRVIKGQKFSYTAPGSKMLLGEKDKMPTVFPRPYLKAPLNDRCSKKVYLKCRQSEITESEMNDNLYLAITRPNTVIQHLFPTAGMAEDIAKTKLSFAISESPMIQSKLSKPYNITQKIFGKSVYSMLGSWNEFGGRGPSADKITYDEAEFQNPKIKEIFAESMSHSQLQIEVTLSTPILPGGPISRDYNTSCQFIWKHKCEHCRKWQDLSFPHNIIGFFERGDYKVDSPKFFEALNKVYLGCRFCKRYIDRTSKWYLQNSVWVPRFPHLVGIKNGYLINYLMLPWKTAKEVLLKYHSFTYIEQFWNEVMGVAYLSEQQHLTDSIFEKCTNHELKNTIENVHVLDKVSIGIDWGKTESWLCVGGSTAIEPRKFKVVYMECINNDSLERNGLAPREDQHTERASKLFELFEPSVLVNDANGLGTDRNSILINRYRNRAFGAFYDTAANMKQITGSDRKASKIIKPLWNDKQNRVTINRVGIFKQLLNNIRNGDIEFPHKDRQIEIAQKHIRACNIITRKQTDGEQEIEIMVSTGPDHYAHAIGYCYVGWQRITSGGEDGVPIGIFSDVIN